jgi:hypothetical protein
MVRGSCARGCDGDAAWSLGLLCGVCQEQEAALLLGKLCRGSTRTHLIRVVPGQSLPVEVALLLVWLSAL